jgi:hypothetical protein
VGARICLGASRCRPNHPDREDCDTIRPRAKRNSLRLRAGRSSGGGVNRRGRSSAGQRGALATEKTMVHLWSSALSAALTRYAPAGEDRDELGQAAPFIESASEPKLHAETHHRAYSHLKPATKIAKYLRIPPQAKAWRLVGLTEAFPASQFFSWQTCRGVRWRLRSELR